MEHLIVIPARMASSRLPGKPLVDIEGKSLIQRTYEQCLKALPYEQVVVATDDQKIMSHCNDHGLNVIMTSSDCLTGTDRVAEVAQKMDADFYINVQGDEPLINPQDILDVKDSAKKYPGEVINGYAEINDEALYRSLTIPKVVLRPDGKLLYMSRSPIPGNKNGDFQVSWRQICVYGFPKKSLADFTSCSHKTPLEKEEDIEILRFLELGYEVRMIPLSDNSVPVDTPEDIEKVKDILNNG